MFTIRIGGANTFVVFKQEDVTRLAKRGVEYVTQVSCGIFAVGTSGPRPLSIGYAFKSEKDEQNDTLAAELALGRALQKLTSDKSVRAKYWAAFNQSTETLEDRSEELDIELDIERDASVDRNVVGASGPYMGVLGVLDAIKTPSSTTEGQPYAQWNPPAPDPELVRLEKELAEAAQRHTSYELFEACALCADLRKRALQRREELAYV